MDIQKKPEFTETINLVKAVLERLEFHAFEEVLIWSEEHASKALLRCLKKTLSEFENGHLVLTSSYPKLKHFSIDTVTSGLMTALDQAQERQDNLNREIDELKDQLAKAQAVPECSAIKDVIGERQRQISHEFYSTEHDDEYKSNELLRAAVCYAENVLSRGWVHRSSPNSGIYQSEEAPDFWPWDLDFWKPKSPRKDLVRAAALLIAEIERIDRAQEQKG
ncbi:hypothetical protein [Acinetobacter sp. SA01]|uniref:hypothetical protein n=1 Tax=Acinetobacter sp. SA01 TaxID=1862567 RepID=UPI001F10273E|nr:hypothetical protein [Acinetobacter sp. SA01]